MKTKISLNKLVHNEKLVLIFSLVTAVFLWALIVYGPGNIETRTISVPVSLDLSGTYAESHDIRIVGNATFTAEVSVKGARAVIGMLTGEDIRVKANVGAIQGAGQVELDLTVMQNSKVTEYEFLSVSPASVTVSCDYWKTVPFELTPDIAAVRVEDENTQMLGNAQVKLESAEDGKVIVSGPQTVLDRISRMKAVVDTNRPISSTQTYTARIVALDSNDVEVDMSACEWVNVTDNAVKVTVPVLVQREVMFTYTIKNAPEALAGNRELVSIFPESITLVGEVDQLNQIVAQIADLGVIDFDVLTPQTSSFSVPLDNIPDSVRVLENVSSLTVQVDIAQYQTKKVDVLIEDIEDIELLNPTPGVSISVQWQVLSRLQVCGNKASLDQLKAEDLAVTVDVSAVTGTGVVRLPIRIKVKNYDDVWVYYGRDGYELYGFITRS